MLNFQSVTIFIALISVYDTTRLPLSLPSDERNSLNYRLPNNSLPLHYDMHIETDIHEGSDKFKGKVKINVKILETTDVITMHFRNDTMSIHSVDYYNKEGI